MARQPLIFDIRRFALDDGPGIRTVVFFKGCPLRCSWCHNPESMRTGREIAFHADRCIGCGECASHCPQGAIILQGARRIDRARCDACGRCADLCPTRALEKIGESYPTDALVAKILRDRTLFETSGGGVTLSGGEPTLFGGYLEALLRKLKEEGIHLLIETCGMFRWAGFRDRILPYVDMIYFDIKIANPLLHRHHTGAGNEAILANLRALASVAPQKVVPRVPLIPGITDTEANRREIEGILRDLGMERYITLPYNPGGSAKRASLDQPINSCSESIAVLK